MLVDLGSMILHVDGWHGREELLRFGVHQRLQLLVPSGSLQEKPIDEAAVLGLGRELFRGFLAHHEGKRNNVDREAILAGVVLKNGRQEPL